MNTSPALAPLRRLAVLLALAVTATPLLAREDAPPPVAPPGAVDANDPGDQDVDPNTGLPRNVGAIQAQVSRAALDMKRQVEAMSFGYSGAVNDRLLIVPDDDASTERVGALREELSIMSHLLAKAANPETGKRGAFRFNLAGWGFGQGGDLDALYLDGYGAVFLLDVDFPLVEGKTPEKKTVAKEDKDAAWEKARRELSGDDRDDAADSDDDPFGRKNPAYDAEKVAGLRKRLTEALRHAANLKGVKDDEQLVIVVTGRGPAQHGGHGVVVNQLNGVKGVRVFGGGDTARSQLTLRAKKSVVDAFAAGQLSAEEFAKKVTITTREEAASPRPKPGKMRTF